MKIPYLLSIQFLLIFFNPLFAQNQVIEVRQNSFLLNMIFNSEKYQDEKNFKFITRDYYEFTDPSKSGTYKLPSKEIIIAIPPYSKPSFSVISKEENVVDNIIPKLNPVAKVIRDSVIVYEDIELQNAKVSEVNNPIIEVMDYFWLRDFYCARIKIRTHSYNETESKLRELTSIKIEVKLDQNMTINSNSELKIKSTFDTELKSLICNSGLAEQFRSSQKPLTSDTTGNWIDYDKSYLKIGTATDGLVRVTKSDLENLNISASIIDPRTFKLYESGKEKRIYVNGESDGVFDDNDYIEFWGSKNYNTISSRIINTNNEDYNEYLNRYTDTTFYFLCWGGNYGLRTLYVSNFINGLTDTLKYYSYFTHTEKNTMLQFLNNDEVANQMPNWYKNKAWVWEWLFTSPKNITFQASDIYPNQTASFYFKLISGGSNVVSNSHNIKLSVNNTKLDSQVVNRYGQVLLNGKLNSNNLISGSNTLTVHNVANGTNPNYFATDWYEIEYPRKLNLINDSLYFKIDDELQKKVRLIKIGNINSNDLVIYKVKPELKKVNLFYLIPPYLVFTDTIKGGDAYVIITPTKISKPVFYKYRQFANLRNANKQADYIAVTTPKFINSSKNYTSNISSLFLLSTELTSTDDIFDEFGYGYPEPEAIKTYLRYAYQNWRLPKPSYLCLIGDANYDYKLYRYKNDGVIGGGNYVPSFGAPVSDNWFAVWDNSTLPIPQLKVGRLPINKDSDLDYFLSKVVNNENLSVDGWNKRYLFFSGGSATNADEIAQLRSVNESIINQYIVPVPISGKYTHFYKTISPLSDFGPYTDDQFSDAINNGGVFISYIGHSGTATWDNSISEVDQLENSVNRNPFITDFGCSTNKFAEPDIVCFGERFVLNTNGQALGYIGNSSLGFTSSSTSVPNYFYEAIIKDSSHEIGGAHVAAKIKMFNQLGGSNVYKVFSLTNTLIGDPAVRIKIPAKPNLKISPADVSFGKSIINDDEDSTSVMIVISNLGLATGDSATIRLSHFKEDQLLERKEAKVFLPNYQDSITIWIKTKNLAGKHSLVIDMDVYNNIDEIYEDDNQVQITFNVFSLELRDLIASDVENGTIACLSVLSPVYYQKDSLKIKYLLSKDKQFNNYNEKIIAADSFYTKITFDDLDSNKRYWFKYKIDGEDTTYSSIKSFNNIFNSKYFVGDSTALVSQKLNGTLYKDNRIVLSNDSLVLSVISAGYYAGANCVISLNGRNLLSNSFFSGMGIAVFDEKYIAIDTVQWYALFNNPTNMQQLVSLINSIPEGKIVAIGVASDAANNITTALKNAIKTLGSTKIDQLKFRGSWALIGKKGVSAGQVIEEIKGPYDGSIFIDSTFDVQNSSGNLVTNNIGPASKWENISISSFQPEDSRIKLQLVGIKNDSGIDTLSSIALMDSINIENINAADYPYLKIITEFQASTNGASPILSSLGVDYTGIPELGTNYQVVSIAKDSLVQGDSVKINFYVYNVGESPADSFDVKLFLVKPDNSQHQLFDSLVVRLDSMSRKYFTYNYHSNSYDGYGKMNFRVSIDDSNKILELYEDNNVYDIPINIEKDTTSTSVTSASLAVTYDGVEIIDGDFISPSPEISMTLSYPVWFPVSDSTSVQVFLDGEKVNYSSLKIFSDTINRKLIFTYLPSLTDGEHTLRVYGKNIIGNIENSPGYEKVFNVSNKMNIMQVYNYPNPFKDNTLFTFKLSQVPDEFRIKIYTVAGRMIKELKRLSSELKYDFNQIPWDGRDEDGNLVANGVYLYRIQVKKGDKQLALTQKLAIVR